MKRLARACAATLAFVATTAFGEIRLQSATVNDVADAITELDVERARKLCSEVDTDSAALALERARLSLYVGDCDAASATLSTLRGVKDAASLTELSKNCARATAGSVVIEDAARGLWIRLQDEDDRVLVPLLSEVAVKARAAIERDLGVVMPKPLRIDLVRDLFSLSAVSGLPLSAAETTGTVAVARWGRVNMISPRAAPGGFPWEDTLAHEITHLALARATRDGAPLWLQEGTAKRQETRWRAPKPFDGEPAPDAVARDALLSGQSVGVDKLGPSIAMLPSADAASIAFAEVSSFVAYWIQQNGKPAMMMLFADLKGLGGARADDAMRSVSGYDLAGWISKWQSYLRTLPNEPPEASDAAGDSKTALGELVTKEMPVDARSRARKTRTAELLFDRGAPDLAASRLESVLSADPADPVIRWRLGRSLIAAGNVGAGAALFASPDGLTLADAGWFALEGRYRQVAPGPASRVGGKGVGAGASAGAITGVGAGAAATDAFDFAKALDPYLEDAACEGQFSIPDATGQRAAAPTPADPARRALCEAARKLHAD